MRESEQKEFEVYQSKNSDGSIKNTKLKYSCKMLPATVSQKTLVRLLEILGQPILLAVAKGWEESADMDAMADAGIHALFDKLTPESSNDVIKTLIGCVRCEGEEALTDETTYDEHFAGRILHLYKLMGWIIEVNYRDFFVDARLAPLFGGLRRMAERAETPSTLTQEFGD